MSEFNDDLKNIFNDALKEREEEKIKDLIDEIKDIRYGFKDKYNGKVYDNREWIHNCKDLGRYYEVQKDPRITLKDKLGICTDQCLAIDYLMKQKYPDLKPQLYALTKGRFGHCTFGFKDGNDYYYLENAWDKMKKDDRPTLYGPFNSEDHLKDYFKEIYFNAHKEDNDDPVEVRTYDEYLKESLNENFIFFK